MLEGFRIHGMFAQHETGAISMGPPQDVPPNILTVYIGPISKNLVFGFPVVPFARFVANAELGAVNTLNILI